MTKSLFCIIIIFFIHVNINGQNILKNIVIDFDFGFQKQDRRLFDLSYAKEIIDKEDEIFDFQYTISVQKVINLNSKIINLSPGIGYSKIQTKFSRPFNHNYFTGEGTYEVKYIKKYDIHNICLSNNININLPNSKLFIEFPFLLNITVNKNIKSNIGYWQKNKWKFDFHNLEMYTGIGFKIGKLKFSCDYRFFNVQSIDKVIFYHLLFNTSNNPPTFLMKKNEVYNLPKAIFQLRFDL